MEYAHSSTSGIHVASRKRVLAETKRALPEPPLETHVDAMNSQSSSAQMSLKMSCKTSCDRVTVCMRTKTDGFESGGAHILLLQLVLPFE